MNVTCLKHLQHFAVLLLLDFLNIMQEKNSPNNVINMD